MCGFFRHPKFFEIKSEFYRLVLRPISDGARTQLPHTSRTLRCVGSSATGLSSRSNRNSTWLIPPPLSDGTRSTHTFATYANVWGTRQQRKTNEYPSTDPTNRTTKILLDTREINQPIKRFDYYSSDYELSTMFGLDLCTMQTVNTPDRQRNGAGGPPFMIVVHAYPNEGAPSLRFLQGWETMLSLP